MSTKLLRSLTDEKTDMQKQLGCMNGIFQLFDRHNFSRRATSHNNRRLSAGQDINTKMEQSGIMDKRLVGKEKLTAPVELSRTSFSSSCSSSTFSPADCNKTSQSEHSSTCRSSFAETTYVVAFPKKQQSSSSHLSQPSFDIRDIVKGSMYRESHGLSVKTTAKEGREHAIKHIDSPRPSYRQKSVQPKVRHDGSLRTLAKFQDAPRNAKEQQHGSLPLAPRDAPRYSYDERESREKFKTATKLKELPRLSLDSREIPFRSSASQLRSNNLSREICNGSGTSSHMINLHPEPGSNKRPSAIVARLMGLEPITDCILTDNHQMRDKESYPDKHSDTISRSTICDESKQKQVTGSPRVSSKIPASLHLTNENPVIKSTSSSKFPQEPGPWRQGNQCSQKQELQDQESSTNSPHVSPSVYGEIEKRLTELEFKKSGKDLRALKQILEEMEKTRARIGINKEHVLNSESPTSKCSSYNSIDQASTQQRQSNYPMSPIIKGSRSPRRYGTQLVATKLAKLHQKPGTPPDSKPYHQKKWSGDDADNIKDMVVMRTAKDITPRKNHLRDSPSCPTPCINKKKHAETQRSARPPKTTQHMGEENPASFRKSSFETLSPREKQKMHKMGELSCQTTQTSGMRRTRKQSMKLQQQSVTPTRKYKHKHTNLQQGDDQLSWSSSETRNLSHQGDTVSMQSDSGISMTSHSDIEVRSTDLAKQITGAYQLKDPDDEDFMARFKKDRIIAELATATLEQPSPVSVLDITFYEEDSPSPVKKRSTYFQDYGCLNNEEAEWNAEYIDHLQNSTRSNPSSMFDRGKLQNIDNLVHKLHLMNDAQDEATKSHIESLSYDTNPDHRYVAEILVAAGIIVDLGSRSSTIQLLPSGFPINPNLFHVLEIILGNSKPAGEHHEKKGAQAICSEKIQRKLMFDIVNETLVKKSALASSREPWIFQNKMGQRSMSGEQLLKEVCSKLDHQRATKVSSLDDEDELTSILRADMLNEPESSRDYTNEFPGIVLDIERLIFKDLICEVVSGEAAHVQVHPVRHCRKLFSE